MAPTSQKKVKWKIEYILLQTILRFFALFPLSTRYKCLETFLFCLLRIGLFPKSRIKKNIDFIFDTSHAKRREKIILANVRRTAMWLSEFIELEKMDDAFLQSHVKFYPNKEKHVEILDKGCLILMGHLGLLEYSAHAMSFCTGRQRLIYSLVRKIRNPYAEKLVHRIRKKCGVGILYNDGNVRKLLQLLKDGQVVVMPADQDAGKHGLFVEFLGKPASTFLGPAFIARNSTVPIYIYSNWHTKNGHFCCAFEEIKRPTHINDKKEWERIFTKRWISSLETAIRKHVADYFWLHQRWRHQPTGVLSATKVAPAATKVAPAADGTLPSDLRRKI